MKKKATIEAVMDALVEHGRVQVNGFGSLRVQERGEFKTVNPVTREPMIVPPQKVIVFRPSNELKGRVNGK